MISNDRIATYIHSLEVPESPVIEAIEQEALDTFVPIIRKETQSFLDVYKRQVVKLDQKKAQKKCARWQEIARSAAKQAGRGYIPKVHEVLSYREALAYSEQLRCV